MMARTLAAVARAVGGRLDGPDATFADVSIDSRTIAPGDLFVAVKGRHADGHDFVDDAGRRGAAGALVSRISETAVAQIEVNDTTTAFGAMARAWRAGFDIPVVAVTGSNGKTTVKELIATILSMRRSVCASPGSLNNHLGVPLTLMSLRSEHAVLVAELGANHAGEIDYLAGLVAPSVGVITNANASHLEGFGSIAGVATAKGELLDHLPRAGTAVLNADDAHFADWRGRSRAETIVTFGLTEDADFTVEGDVVTTAEGSKFTLRFPEGERIDVALGLRGRHNVANALAAAGAAIAAGATVEDVVAGLAHAHAVRGRVNVRPGPSGSAIIDDSYNANPASMRAALDCLSEFGGTRIAVLGDMGELGDAAEALHAAVGEYAKARCDLLLCIGDLTHASCRAFGHGARAFADLESLEVELLGMLGPTTTVLIKASRFMGLERLVALLCERVESDAVKEAIC